jgi:hypothetical protein
MPAEAMTKAALHKRLTTKPSGAPIALLLEALAATPSRLHELRARHAPSRAGTSGRFDRQTDAAESGNLRLRSGAR